MDQVEQALQTVVLALGGETRAGQVQMAKAVAKAMDGHGHLLVQAGTGTGKSLGYLVPALVHAASAGQGQARTMVATATLALQRQLVGKDLPQAVQALGQVLPRTPTFALYKGRYNYVCLDRFNRAPIESADDPDVLIAAPRTALGKQARALRDWVGESQTGDRDEYPGELDSRIWRSVAVTGRECIGAARCPYGQECFAELAKTAAQSADIVVTNHALLALDVQEEMHILPEYDALVIDEAHELVDRVTTALASDLSADLVSRAAKLARRFVEPQTAERMLESADALEVALLELEPGRIVDLDSATHSALTLVRDAARAATAQVLSPSENDPDATARHQARAAVQECFKTAGEMLNAGRDEVLWRGIAASLHVAPLAVDLFLHDRLFLDHTAILTSATLGVDGDLARTASNLGLPEGEWTGLDVGSPFDYAQQGILYCAGNLPPPGRDGVAEEVLDELAELIEAAGGRTLALFSSWAGVERAAEYLKVRLDLPLVVAKRGDTVARLVEQFRAEPHTCLLGTVSLWQGIDVPGDTCTLVTIDRIPFPRPDDPIVQARSQRADDAGGSGFASVSVPKAALLLAQGVGRLIRTMEDRGVVAVLDSRLATKGYGKTLRRSLPPLWWTTDGDAVRSALRRLDEAATTRENRERGVM